ncbi:MAG: DUF4236 domain-containing protein [Candidatus Eremiobacteraeota bacterium]|nr:DUF4236 domain-containing protein [Candidatus Eremiobacteraeota bacterium]
MPWYFRRSFGRGPVRLNLSRRGVGVSVGMRGFRFGTGPRGAYVRAGRGGFYYQQYFARRDQMLRHAVGVVASSDFTAAH